MGEDLGCGLTGAAAEAPGQLQPGVELNVSELGRGRTTGSASASSDPNALTRAADGRGVRTSDTRLTAPD